MGAVDALWHLLNLLAPALGVGVISAWCAKLLWRRELKGVSPWRLSAWAVAASAVALVAGLAWAGQDGKMNTYGAMVLACGAALWWAGWHSPRT